MKKILSYLLIGTLVFSLSACGELQKESDSNQTYISDTGEKDTGAEEENTGKDKNVGNQNAEAEVTEKGVSVTDTKEPEKSAIEIEMDENTPEGILAGINEDFAETIGFFEAKLEAVNTQIGETYEGYVENKQLLTEWYALVQSESQLLFDRTRENSIKYFRLIAADKENTDALDDAMDDFYDEIMHWSSMIRMK